MKKIKRILVGIDVFDKSNFVLKRAFMLAKEHDATLFIVHAVQVPWLSVPGYFSSDSLDIDRDGIERKLEKKIKSTRLTAKVPYTIFVKEGNADDIILYEAKLIKADMIMIGAHSRSKGMKNLLGTTAQKITNKSHLPLLIVKNSVKERYQDILAPTDFQRESSESVRFVQQLCPNSKISTVHSSETIYLGGPYAIEGIDFVEYNVMAKEYARKDLKDFMHAHAIKKGKIIDGGINAKEALIKYITKGSYDLVAIGSRSTSGFNALLGSVALTLLKDSPTDILVYVP
ncbi:MAG: universal stress protein [Campylobacterota bacterium]|nr:universal stress protein [Campylobacterota bacterium]